MKDYCISGLLAACLLSISALTSSAAETLLDRFRTGPMAGVNEFVYSVSDIPDEIRRLLGIGGNRGPAPVFTLTSPSDLRVMGGGYMSYQQYETARVSRIITSASNPKQGIWPVLPRPVYEMLVQFYTQMGSAAFIQKSAAAP